MKKSIILLLLVFTSQSHALVDRYVQGQKMGQGFFNEHQKKGMTLDEIKKTLPIWDPKTINDDMKRGYIKSVTEAIEKAEKEAAEQEKIKADQEAVDQPQIKAEQYPRIDIDWNYMANLKPEPTQLNAPVSKKAQEKPRQNNAPQTGYLGSAQNMAGAVGDTVKYYTPSSVKAMGRSAISIGKNAMDNLPSFRGWW